MRVAVNYQIGTYRGKVELDVDENAEREEIIARAKKDIFRFGAPAAMYYEHYTITQED